MTTPRKRAATFVAGERCRVLLDGWHGVWRIKRIWNTNTEGFAADLERVDPTGEGESPLRSGTALVGFLERER